MAGPIIMNVGNFSLTDNFTLCNGYTGYQTQAAITNIEKYPESSLPKGGSTSMEMSEGDLSGIATGDAWINFGWKCDGKYWGTKIYIRQQVLDMGHQPYYEVSQGDNDTPSWNNPVSNPAKPYTFPSSCGWKILITPTATHTALTIDINVSDLS